MLLFYTFLYKRLRAPTLKLQRQRAKAEAKDFMPSF